MGNLVTLTIRTNGIHEILNDPKGFCDEIEIAMNSGKTVEYGPVKIQKCRHADEQTLYVHMGNTVCEMNPYSDETRRLLERSPEFYSDMLSYMKSTVRALEELKRLNAPEKKK
jgi:hypothetical protein